MTIKKDNKSMIKGKSKIKVFEAFAGYGGASFGLIKAGIEHEVIGYSEVDSDAIELFEYNFPMVKNYGDITKIEADDLPDFDLFTGGFPCQPFSTVGKRLGEMDIRGTLFEDIIRICRTKTPKYILLENVKGLSMGKLKPTFEKIISELKTLGYDVKHAILNSKDYGVPQNRERLWIFGYLGTLPTQFKIDPPKEELKKRLKDFLDKNVDIELYRSEAQIARIKHLHDIDLFEVHEPLCYDYYNRKLRTDGLCMTVTPPEHNVIRIVEPIKNGKERVRKLSLDEHFRLMGFELSSKKREIKFPKEQNYTKLGRRAGNGWDVNLVSKLLNHIFNQLI
jgi:DNA (cytosine-5)-methyltransferase 1